jgi:hypothetical protein
MMPKQLIKFQLPALNDGTHYQRWQNALQDYAFRLFQNNNLSAIKAYQTLRKAHFRTVFPVTYQSTLDELEAGGADINQEGFNPLNPAHYGQIPNALFDRCFEHAIETGTGFKSWVYTLFSDIKSSLGPEMADKTAFVRHGDFLGLMTAIKLAINHSEIFNPEDLEAEYSKCSMAAEGQNELARFISVLANFIRRLEAVQYPPRDAKKQRIFLCGLDQEVFEGFITMADRTPYASYAALLLDVQRFAQKPHIVRKLANLKPGRPQSMLITNDKPAAPEPAPDSTEQRLLRMEKMLTTMHTKTTNKRTRTKELCRNFARTGTCKFGDKCIFEHAKGVTPDGSSSYCDYHKAPGHSTANCRDRPKAQEARINVTDYVAEHFVLMTNCDGQREDRDVWVMDGASTSCATWDKSICFNVRSVSIKVTGSDNSSYFMCTSIGDTYVPVYCRTEDTTFRMLVKDVLISEKFPTHILSEIVLFSKSCTAIKDLKTWRFNKPDGSWLLDASQHVKGSSLYYVITKPPAQLAQVLVTAPVVAASQGVPKVSTAKNLKLLIELHCAMSHRNFRAVGKQYGLTLPEPLPDCWACMLAKPRHITPDDVSLREVSRPFEGVAVDWKGPFSVRTPEGFLGFFLIIDLFSSRSWVHLAATSSEWSTFWPHFVARIQAKLGTQGISFVITDGAKIFSQASITHFNEEKGIENITTAPFSQWQNPAERCVQTVVRGAVAYLIHGGGPDWAWGHAIHHSNDSLNRSPPSTAIPGKEGMSRLRLCQPTLTLEQEMRNHKPFMCLCFKTTPDPYRLKDFSPRAEACVHLRYDPARKAYVILSLPHLNMFWSLELRFVADSFPLRSTSPMSRQLDLFVQPTADDLAYSSIHGPANMLRKRGIVGVGDRALISSTPALVQPVRRSARIADASINITTAVLTTDQMAALTPVTAREALTGPYKEQWARAMLKDFVTLRKNRCFINITAVPPPRGIRFIDAGQRFRNKYKGPPTAMHDLPPEVFKARTVVMGNRMQHGIHYDETAAPVISTPTNKMLITIANARDQLLFGWDVEGAFYVGGIDKPGIIARLPLGFNPLEDQLRPIDEPRLYGELANGLPGTPQGSLLFYKAATRAWATVGFYPSPADPCLLLHESSQAATSMHVDDGILAIASLAEATALFAKLHKTGYVFTWGPLKRSLGIEYCFVRTPDARMVFMHQRTYALTILQRASMLECKAAPTPAVPGTVYSKKDCPSPAERAQLDAAGETKELYHTLVQSCNFLCVNTRLDLTFQLGKLSKFVANPGAVHWKALKRMLRYIKGTLDYGVEFLWQASHSQAPRAALSLEAFCDSSYADCPDTARSTVGFVFLFGGVPILASSKLTLRVDSCINHSELNAFDSACNLRDESVDGSNLVFVKTARTAAWLRATSAALQRIAPSDMPPTPVKTDNDGLRSITANVTLPAANRHIFKTIAECRERVHLDKDVVPVRVDSADNIADCLTKPSLKGDMRLLALARPASLTADIPKQDAPSPAAASRGQSALKRVTWADQSA